MKKRKTPSASPPAPGDNGSDPAAKLLAALGRAACPLGRSDLLSAAGIDPKDWSAAIKKLKNHQKIKQIGERRGARYVLADRGQNSGGATT